MHRDSCQSIHVLGLRPCLCPRPSKNILIQTQMRTNEDPRAYPGIVLRGGSLDGAQTPPSYPKLIEMFKDLGEDFPDYRYVPFGSLIELTPYLLRRFVERLKWS